MIYLDFGFTLWARELWDADHIQSRDKTKGKCAFTQSSAVSGASITTKTKDKEWLVHTCIYSTWPFTVSLRLECHSKGTNESSPAPSFSTFMFNI